MMDLALDIVKEMITETRTHTAITFPYSVYNIILTNNTGYETLNVG